MTRRRRLIAEFEVPGEPISKSRARFTKRGSKTQVYTPQKTKTGEFKVALAFRQALAGLELNPTDTEITYRVESEFLNGTRQRRDVDNMTKLVLDGLNGVAWVDDNQVLEIESSKCYVPKAEAKTIVRVFEIGRFERLEAKCIRCSKPFPTYESWKSNPNGKKYCSRSCVYSHRIERRQRVCTECGAGFLAWGEMKETKFCSMECKAKASRVDVECTHCGLTFNKQKCWVRAANYCSSECLSEAAKVRKSTRFPGICDVCGGGTTRKEYHMCRACRYASGNPTGSPKKES